MKRITRRDFMKSSMAAGVALALPFSRVRGANNDIRLATIGLGGQGGMGQGKYHIRLFRKIPGVRVVAICDPDKDVLDAEVKKFKERDEKVDAYTDVRKLLEDKSIDAITTATPNHWHALVTIWACQAGKDVYVEKPAAYNIWESRKMIEAARKYDRIVQVGTQRRSDEGLQQAIEYIQQGNLGKIKFIHGLCYRKRESIGKVYGPQPVPESIDYNLWTGPAPLVPLMRKRLHYDWHWIWATGNGDLGNNGIHTLDLCRWALGKNTLPAGGSVGTITARRPIRRLCCWIISLPQLSTRCATCRERKMIRQWMFTGDFAAVSWFNARTAISPVAGSTTITAKK
ncbi:MAG: Gfo/Idh/MocA family oxidoreductase [Planctomycetota bacterium]|jgi:predicted dehydrogenase